MSDNFELRPPAPFVGPPNSLVVTLKLEREGYQTISVRQPMDIAFLRDNPAWCAHLTYLAQCARDKQEREGRLPGEVSRETR